MDEQRSSSRCVAGYGENEFFEHSITNSSEFSRGEANVVIILGISINNMDMVTLVEEIRIPEEEVDETIEEEVALNFRIIIGLLVKYATKYNILQLFAVKNLK
ncbi:hypothetical protein Syun_027835 [Stephania yunnanensis]|uniref:Uncharacterized protein n=1 Tax=Stephania yunnanensis TaxID=152371 RepID=A0AAP0HN64_9MAGN